MPNSKGVVNLHGLFVLTVGYVVMTTYLLTKYYYVIKRAYFIYKFFIFLIFITTFSFLLFLYAVSWSYKRDYLHVSIDILLYIISYTICHDEETLDAFAPCSYLLYKKGPD